MVDVAFGPEPGKRPDLANPREAYLDMVRRKRMYGGILLVVFIALMASGWKLSEDRNAGDFLSGLPNVIDFPAEVFSEAWTNRANLPGIFWHSIPSLIETLNIAAVATLLGALALGSTPRRHGDTRSRSRSTVGRMAAAPPTKRPNESAASPLLRASRRGLGSFRRRRRTST